MSARDDYPNMAARLDDEFARIHPAEMRAIFDELDRLRIVLSQIELIAASVKDWRP